MQHTLRPDSSLPDNADLPHRAAIIRPARMRAPIFTSQTICPQLIARIVSLTYKWCMIVFGYADALDRVDPRTGHQRLPCPAHPHTEPDIASQSRISEPDPVV